MNTIKCAGLILLTALCVSCSSAPRVAPRFSTPSTVPIHQSADRVSKHLDDAQQTVGKIAFAKSIDAAKPFILKLRGQITAAQQEIVNLKGETVTLDVKLQEQTTKANKLAGDYDKSERARVKAEATLKQMNKWSGLGAIAYGIKLLVKRILLAGFAITALAAIAAIVAVATGAASFGQIIALGLHGFGFVTSFVRRLFSK